MTDACVRGLLCSARVVVPYGVRQPVRVPNEGGQEQCGTRDTGPLTGGEHSVPVPAGVVHVLLQIHRCCFGAHRKHSIDGAVRAVPAGGRAVVCHHYDIRLYLSSTVHPIMKGMKPC